MPSLEYPIIIQDSFYKAEGVETAGFPCKRKFKKEDFRSYTPLMQMR